MIDKSSKILLNFLDKQPDKQFMYYSGDEYPDELGDAISFSTTARYLESIDMVEFIKTTKGSVAGIQLSHLGAKRKEFSWIKFKQYLINNWIAMIALAIAAGSFVISLIALSNSPPAP